MVRVNIDYNTPIVLSFCVVMVLKACNLSILNTRNNQKESIASHLVHLTTDKNFE